MNPEQFFAHLLQLAAPFTMERVETKMSGTQIKEVILHIAVSSEYRPEAMNTATAAINDAGNTCICFNIRATSNAMFRSINARAICRRCNCLYRGAAPIVVSHSCLNRKCWH